LEKINLPAPLSQAYGQWTVQLGNTALQTELKKWLCGKQKSKFLANTFEKQMGYKQPALPPCV
jgi:hypothetical protein